MQRGMHVFLRELHMRGRNISVTKYYFQSVIILFQR